MFGKTRKSMLSKNHVPALYKVLECFAPFHTLLGLILQNWNRLSDDVGKEVDQTGRCLSVPAPIGGEGKSVLRNLK